MPSGVNAEISYKNVPFAREPARPGCSFTPRRQRVTHAAWLPPLVAPQLASWRWMRPDARPVPLVCRSARRNAGALHRRDRAHCAAAALESRAPVLASPHYRYRRRNPEVAREPQRPAHPQADVLTPDGRARHKPETRFDFSRDPERYPDPAPGRPVRGLRAMNYRLCLWEYSRTFGSKPALPGTGRQRLLPEKPGRGRPASTAGCRRPTTDRFRHLQPSGLIDFAHSTGSLRPGSWAICTAACSRWASR